MTWSAATAVAILTLHVKCLGKALSDGGYWTSELTTATTATKISNNRSFKPFKRF